MKCPRVYFKLPPQYDYATTGTAHLMRQFDYRSDIMSKPKVHTGFRSVEKAISTPTKKPTKKLLPGMRKGKC